MSNDLNTEALTFDGVGRYHNEIKVIVYSHLSNTPLDISQDVIACNTSKAVKSLGSANITLAATRNYFLSIYANDYINIYFNTGDGSGWTRNFFGFIDRVSESSRVGEDGTPTTVFNVVCSDFQKAFERTQIYFNPRILGRRDLEVSSVLGAPNLGGISLMSSGIQASGSPSDMVTNVLYTLMGFASQFILPDSYAPRFSERYRQARQSFLLNNVAPQIREQIQTEGGFEAFYNRLDTEMAADQTAPAPVDTVDAGADPDTIDRRERTRRELALGRALGTHATDGIAGQLLDTLQASAEDAPDTLLDIIDVSTFVERGAIDGFTHTYNQWQAAGSIMQILTGVSNEIVNELFFDLRPMTADRDLSNSEDYSREDDEAGGNQGGVQFVPCLVMREYPFSTIAGIDASDTPILGNARVGLLHFGAIFSHEPNRAGRHVVTIPNINVSDLYAGNSTERAVKHLDVATINSGQIIESDIGRSDADHFNLLEVMSTDLLGQDARFFSSNFLPIITPVHVIRHGLRVRSLETTFARFDARSFRNFQTAAEPTPEPTEQPEEVSGLSTDIPGKGIYERPAVSIDWVATAVELGCDSIVFRSETLTSAKLASADSAGLKSWIFSGPESMRPSSFRATIGHLRDNCAAYPTLKGYLVDVETAVDTHGDGDAWGGARRQDIADLGEMLHTDSQNLSVGFTSFPSWPHYRTIARAAPNVWGSPQLYGLLNPGTGDQLLSRGNPWSTSFTGGYCSTLAAYDRNGIEQREYLDGLAGLPNVLFWAASSLVEPGVKEAIRDYTPTRAEAANRQEPTSSIAGGSVDSAASQRQLARWALLHDHWYQHNLEYLSGNFMIRGNPMIRPGYRLDWTDRNLSFYIESANQQFQYPNKLTTMLEVSRGQPTNPHPVYVLPGTESFNPGGHQRTIGSRLDSYFKVADSSQAARAVAFRGNEFLEFTEAPDENYTDSPDTLDSYDENLISSDGSDLDAPTRRVILDELFITAGGLSDADSAELTDLLDEVLNPEGVDLSDERGTVDGAVDGGLDA